MALHTNPAKTTPPPRQCMHERHEDDCLLIKGYVIPRDLLASQSPPVIDPSWLARLSTQQ